MNAEVLPFWREADARISRVVLPATSPAYPTFQYLNALTSGRHQAYQHMATAIQRNDLSGITAANAELKRVDELIEAQQQNPPHAQ